MLFYPTLFKFSGREVLYPSPSRLLFSIGKDIARCTGRKKPIRFVRDLLDKVELIEDRTKVVELRIGKHTNGKQRKVSTFYGKAKYLFSVGKDMIPSIREMLNLLNLFGVGKNRSMGLGFVKVPAEDVNI